MELVKKNFPELRFSEFIDEWNRKKLGSISLKIGSGKTPKGGEKIYTKIGIPFIRSQNVSEDSLKLDSTCIPFNIHKEMKGSTVYPNDILLNITGGSIGRSCVVPDNFQEGNVNQHVCIIRLKNYNPFFLQSILSSRKGQKLIYQGQTGSGREGLNFENIKGFKFYFPSLPEQTKIAYFLTAVDKKIEQLTEKRNLLEQYKKGIMQQIFSQKLRFKDENGKDYPDWEEKKLGEVYSFKVTNSYSRNDLNYENGKVKNIHYGDIHTKYRVLFDVTKEIVPFINLNIPINKISEENYCKEGDIIFADASEDYNDIGKNIEIVNLNNEKVLSGLHTILARPNQNILKIGFGGYLMKTDRNRLQIMKKAQGTKVLGISITELSKISLSLPCKEEQTKIADFLTAIDKKIELINTQIEDTQQFKKGLLQQMFV